MDNSKRTQVFAELASFCRKEKSKWAFAAFNEEFEQSETAPVVQEGAVPVPVAAPVVVPVVEPVGVRPEEGVVNPPRLFEHRG